MAKDKDIFISKVVFQGNSSELENRSKDIFRLPDINSKPNGYHENDVVESTTRKRPSNDFVNKINPLKNVNRKKGGPILKLFHQTHLNLDSGSDPKSNLKTIMKANTKFDDWNSKQLSVQRTRAIPHLKVPDIMPIDDSELDRQSVLSIEVQDLRRFPNRPFISPFISENSSEENGMLRDIKSKEISVHFIAVDGINKAEESLPESQIDADLECWMSKLPLQLQRIPLHHLLIPGSHDSFSYSLELGEVGPDSPSVVSYFATCTPCIAWPAIFRWSVTQKATVYEQLSHGVRYFDIRVAVRDKRFYFVHGLFGADLEPLLAEIRLFLDNRPGEVVLLDFQHLHGLSKNDHMSLIHLLRNVFCGLICPFYDSLNHLSLSYLSKQKYQALIFYRNSEIQKESGLLWPGSVLPNPWPQATRISKLMTFIERELNNKSEQTFFVTQCVLTPTGGYLAKNLTGSLEKKMAMPCNQEVLQWVLSLPNNGNRRPNVIMIDFVENDDWAIPRAVVRHNVEKGLNIESSGLGQSRMISVNQDITNNRKNYSNNVEKVQPTRPVWY